MVRTPSCDKSGLRKGTWTPEEDKKLIAYVTRYGSWNWRQLPRFAGLARCGKSCRLRWMNYLRPNLKRGNFTQDEEEIIIKLHRKLGNRWSAIAAELPGRTDNEIKNHWHTTLKKRFQENKEAPIDDEEQANKSSKSKDNKKSSTTIQEKDSVMMMPNNYSQISDFITTTSVPLSPISSSSSEFSSSMTTSSDHSLTNESFLIEDDVFSFLDGSFWNEQCLAEILSTPTPTNDNNHGASQIAQDTTTTTTTTTTTQIFDACASFVDLDLDNDYEFSESFMVDQTQQTEPMIDQSFWTDQAYVSYADVSHVPSEYSSPLCGADLWSTVPQNNSYMYDEHLSLF